MKVEKLLKRLKIEFFKVNLIQASLDSILFFMVSNLILFFIDQKIVGNLENYLILTPITLLFFGIDLYYRLRNYHLEIYEEENPELKEVLRTARDNIDKQNIASQALFDDVVDRARKVTSESIIPSKEIFQKILAIGILSFLIVFSGLTDLQLERKDATILPKVDLLGGNNNKTLNETKVLNGSKIMGEEADIKVESQEFKFNISDEGKSSDTFSFDAAAEEFSLESSYKQREEDLELAKRYSLAIKHID